MSSEHECIFCRIVRGEIPGDRLFEDETVIAFRDIQPAAPTHILIIPRKHIASVSDLRPDDGAIAGQLLLAAGWIANQEGLREQGYRVVTNTGKWGGQSVDHLHLHLLGGRQLGSLG
ncbi:MAG: histidine triad nucleotide-binding protein [Thermomicrobiales bacterium]